MSLELAMEALSRGERAAFDEVYIQLQPVITSFCLRYLGPDDAQDASQEVLKRLFYQAGAYRPGNSVKSWALTIAYWQCRTLRRRKARNREFPDGDNIEMHRAQGPLLEEQAEQRQAIDALVLALEGVSESDRAAIVASVMQSEAMTPAFRKRKQRALQRIRIAWRKIYGES